MLFTQNIIRIFMLSALIFVFGLSASRAMPTDLLRPGTDSAGGRTPRVCKVTIVHPEGLPDIPAYDSPSFSQKIVESGPTSITLLIEVPARLPWADTALTTASGHALTEPTERIQSDHPAIQKIADEIVAECTSPTLGQMLQGVVAWMAANIDYKTRNPAEITDALTALERGAAHGIGQAHLAVAIFRAAGIPARPVRLYGIEALPGPRLRRTSALEVLDMASGEWILFAPRFDLPLSALNVYLYAAPDWDQAQHEHFKPLSMDPQTQVLIRAVE